MLRLKWLNMAPNSPAATPIKAKINISTKWYLIALVLHLHTGNSGAANTTHAVDSLDHAEARYLLEAAETYRDTRPKQAHRVLFKDRAKSEPSNQ